MPGARDEPEDGEGDGGDETHLGRAADEGMLAGVLEESPDAETRVVAALDTIRELAEDVGPRPPCSAAETTALRRMAARLERDGVDSAIEPFAAYPSFLYAYGPILGAAASAGALPKHKGEALRSALAFGAIVGMALEGGLVRTPVSRAVSRWKSANLVAEVPARHEEQRTLCLVAHADSSRSGLMFHPRVLRWLGMIVRAQSLGVLAGGLESLAGPLQRRGRPRAGRAARAAAAGGRVLALGGLALLVERELRGRDVPGANDNASGVALAASLLAEVRARQAVSTRVVLVLTGAEEAGTLGAQAFLRSRETRDWIFLNLDGVGARATLRYLPREGILSTWPADEKLLGIARRIGQERRELGLREQARNAGLTYDATPVLARGGRALTLSAQDRTIPHYHHPTDLPRNLDPDGIRRALEVGRAFLAAIDRGEAD